MRTLAEITSLADAVADLVNDGDTVALEGFTHLIPVAAGQEIIRQRKRDLTLVRMTPDIVYDQLIGAGCARKLIFSWGGNPGVGSLHRFREAVQTHELEIEEHSHAGMANRYVAAASNLPFAVMRGYNGTSLPEHTDTIKPIACPFTGEWLTAVPALDLDVGIIHAQQADKRGNVQLWGQVGVQKETVLGAKRSLVTVEEIVDELEPRPNARRAAALGGHARRARPRRRQAVLRAGLLRPRQRRLQGVGRDLQGHASSSRPGWRRYELRSRRDDGDRRRARAARRQRLLRGDRAARAPARTSPGAPTPPTSCSSTRRARSAPSRRALPLSIGDGMLGETADAIVSVPEMFNYWVQSGRIDVGFLGAAQIDRYANINTTVIGGDYDNPKVRLPGAGGAPEIAASCGEVIVIVRQSPAGVRGEGGLRDLGRPRRRAGRARAARAARQGPDEGHHRPRHPRARPRDARSSCSRTCTRASRAEQAQEATGWDLKIAADLQTTEPPTDDELSKLRELVAA